MFKSKQLCSKLIVKKEYQRCSLCDSLLKSSPSHRYFMLGKSIHELMKLNNNYPSITYAKCCEKYLRKIDEIDQLTMICLKCSEYLQRIHTWHLDAQTLVKRMCQTFSKTKRLKRLRKISIDNQNTIDIKQEKSIFPKVIESTIPTNIQSLEQGKCHIDLMNRNSKFIQVQSSSTDPSYNDSMNNSPISYAQFLIDPPMHEPKDSNNELISLDEEQSLSPSEPGSKNTRLTRRRYEFLITLPSQQSLNIFIENSGAQSNSRWTWRRTSANSRGYKIYYVCNYSMRRHYHPCPAAMYALFNPEGTISIYSHGQHEHIPKDHIPSTITNETKEEIFKCLQSDMSVPDIREHLIRHKLPFGDTKKLNNFVKYHKEILRYGSVTNLRLTGSAYRQPQFWTVRHPTSIHTNPTIL